MVNKPCCIDIYHGNDVQDLASKPLYGLERVKADGIFALIHKASEGTADRDQRYDARREKWMTGNPIDVTDVDGAKIKLTPVFAGYHFFHGPNPKGEAANFLMTARYRTGDMAFIDWEAVGPSGFQPSVEAADTFCQIVEQAIGRECGVYGGNVPRERFAAEKVSSEVQERFSKRPLWFCGYGSEKLLNELPEPWKETGAFLWQDDGDRSGPGPHTIPGISGYCDNSTVVAPMTFWKFHGLWLGLQPEVAPEAVPVAAAAAPMATAAANPVPEKAPIPEKPAGTVLQRLEAEAEHLKQEIDELRHKPAGDPAETT